MMRTTIGVLIMVALFSGGCRNRNDPHATRERVLKAEFGDLSIDPKQRSPDQRIRHPDPFRLERVESLNHTGALQVVVDLLISKQLVTAVDKAQQACAPMIEEATRFENDCDMLDKQCVRKEISRAKRDMDGSKAAEVFFHKTLDFSIPGTLAGKACLYETVIGLFQYSDVDRLDLAKVHAKAKAIAETLSNREQQILRINPAWHTLALEDMKQRQGP